MTIEEVCAKVGVKGLVHIEETQHYIVINERYLYNKETNNIIDMRG